MAELKINGNTKITEESNEETTYSGRTLSELDKIVTSHETILSNHDSIAYRHTIASGTIDAKSTITIEIPPRFGILFVRIYKGYVEVLKEYAMTCVSGWAYNFNEICSHIYIDDGDTGNFTFTFTNNGSAINLKITSNHNSACTYFVNDISI